MKRILVVGAGSIGERHTRCFLRTGGADVTICETQPDRREEVASRYGVRSLTSLDQGLAESPDGVVICTPADQHISMARQVVRAGIDCLIEKPLSISMQGVDELRKETHERQVTVGVAYIYRSHPILQDMREAIVRREFGEPLQVVVTCGQHFPTHRPAYRDIYFRDHAQGGGAIQDALPHMLNACEWLLGPVTKLTADAGHQRLEGVTVEDTVHVITRHEAESEELLDDRRVVMGSLSLNLHQAPNEVLLTVICENGVARFEGHRHRWCCLREPEGASSPDALPTGKHHGWQVRQHLELQRDDVFVQQANNFLQAMAGEREVSCTLEDGRQTLATTLAILDACRSHSWRKVK